MATGTMTYTNQALSVEDIIARLKGKGLAFADETEAKRLLGVVSYFRIAGYLRPLEKPATEHEFKDGAQFERAVQLYSFDAKLRQLAFGAIQNIEVAIRAKMIQCLSMAHGPFWFTEGALCKSLKLYLQNLGAVQREVERSKEDFIKDHFRKYAMPEFPPAWKTLELSSFGTLSKLFANCSDNGVKKKIARELNLPNHEVMESWMVSIASLRNCCAHHSRVWNRVFPMTPTIELNLRGKWIVNNSVPVNRLYATLCCIQYLLDAIQPDNCFKDSLVDMLGEYPMVDVSAMGFPSDWECEPLWKLK